MSHRLTRKRFRDAALIERWRGYEDAVFAQIGASRAAIAALQTGLQGWVVLPGDADYDKDRMLSDAKFDPHPYIIIYCVVENDVRLALNLAWGSNLPPTVRSGGHCTAGYSAGSGMLIDVSNLNQVVIDPVNLIATVGCGCNFARLNAALDEYGLHVPGGECDEVCVGGYMQGGGRGFTSRTFGMHSDNVVEVRVMLADGSIVTAGPGMNEDLWWAVRGGTGGNFGVVLTEVVQLRRLGPVYGWAVCWPLSTNDDRGNAMGALMLLQAQYMLTAPDELNPQVMICYQSKSGPGSSFLPYLMIRGLDTRGAEVGRAVYEAFGALPGATMQYDLTDKFSLVNKTLLETPNEIPQLSTAVWPPEDKQARYVGRDLTPEEWFALLDFYVTTPNPYSYICLELYGGAMNRYPVEQSAFIHRNSAFSAFMDVFWYTPADQAPAEQFLANFCEIMESMWNGEIYQNYPSPNVPDYRKNYWGSAFPTLLAVKQKYDPQNFFRFAQMISPYPDGSTGAAPGQELWPPAIAEALRQPIDRGARRSAGR
jgi:FAD/FMN-containing dehydrogenase